jgi:hypothetical protein
MDDSDKELLYRTDEKVEQLQNTVETRFDGLERKLDEEMQEVKGQADANDQRLDQMAGNVKRNTTIISGLAAGVGSIVAAISTKLMNLIPF